MLGQHARQQHRERGRREIAAQPPRRIDIDARLERCDREMEFLAPDEAPCRGDGLLQIGFVPQHLAQKRFGGGKTGAGREQGFQRVGVLLQMLRQCRGRTQHGGQAAQQSGVALEQREQLHPGPLAREHRIEMREGFVRVRLLAQHGQQAGQQAVEQAARAV